MTETTDNQKAKIVKRSVEGGKESAEDSLTHS